MDFANCNKPKRQRSVNANRLDREYRERLRHNAINKLGGSCCCCGNVDHDVLQIDHIIPINRRTNQAGKAACEHTYRMVRDMDDPSTVYQLLCANCHVKKTRLKGEYAVAA